MGVQKQHDLADDCPLGPRGSDALGAWGAREVLAIYGNPSGGLETD
jgi:hypothetical protein